jgi:predicted branched-subunit amino acid permease
MEKNGLRRMAGRLWGRLPLGFRASTPLLLPTAAVGLSFGLLAAPVLGVLPTVVMSALVWSGTAQFAALSILSAGGGTALAGSAGLLSNTRFLPMGFAVAPSMQARPLRRLLTGALLADASFAIGHRQGGRFDVAAIAWAAPLQYLGWLAGTVAGATGAQAVGDPERLGLDVLFPVFYLSVLLPELRPPRAAGRPMEDADAPTTTGPDEPPRRHGRQPLLAATLAAVVTLALTPVAPPGVPVLAAAAVALIGLRPPRAQTATTSPTEAA